MIVVFAKWSGSPSPQYEYEAPWCSESMIRHNPLDLVKSLDSTNRFPESIITTRFEFNILRQRFGELLTLVKKSKARVFHGEFHSSRTCMKTIDKDKYGHIILDAARKYLRMDWLPAAGEMTADDFKRSLSVAAEAALAHSVESVLVDVRDFSPNPALADICEWRVQHIVPKFDQVIKRFAWLAAAEAPQLPNDGNTFQNTGEAYLSCWFRDEAAAISWAKNNAQQGAS